MLVNSHPVPGKLPRILPPPRGDTPRGIALQRMETFWAHKAEATNRLRSGQVATAASPGCHINAPDVRIGYSAVTEAMWRRVEQETTVSRETLTESSIWIPMSGDFSLPTASKTIAGPPTHMPLVHDQSYPCRGAPSCRLTAAFHVKHNKSQTAP